MQSSRERRGRQVLDRHKALHTGFDELVYSKVRAATGGKLRWAISGGAPLGERLGHFFNGLGVTVLEGYGLTETTAAATVNTPDHMKIGTVGRPLPGVTIRIGEDDEVFIKGGVVFKGYWRNDEATAAASDDGWFATGDLGSLDDEGFLRITGRKKDLIITAGGKNVQPAELEDAVQASPLVSQCVVVGDGRPFIGALVTLDPEELAVWAQRHGRPHCPPSSSSSNWPATRRCGRPSSRRSTTPTSWCREPRASVSSAVLPRELTDRGRRADADPEGEAQRGAEGVRRR